MNTSSSHAYTWNLLISFYITNKVLKKYSSEMLVSEFSNILYRNANDNSQTDCLLINFSEAFDRVAHCCLIENLS